MNPRTNEIPAEIIFNEVLNTLDINKDFLTSFIESFFNYFQRRSEPEETAAELLSFLKANNSATAILTDVPYGMPKYFVLKDLGLLTDKIDLVLTSSEVGFRKPSVEGIYLLLNKFNCTAKETIMVGNEKKDIKAANTAEVFSVLLSSENTIPSWGQTKTIKKLSELKYFLATGTNT